MLTALLTLVVIGIVGLVAVSIVFALIAAVFGLAFGALGLLFKLAPVLLIGYVVFKLVQKSAGGSGSHRQLTSSDQRWLDS